MRIELLGFIFFFVMNRDALITREKLSVLSWACLWLHSFTRAMCLQMWRAVFLLFLLSGLSISFGQRMCFSMMLFLRVHPRFAVIQTPVVWRNAYSVTSGPAQPARSGFVMYTAQRCDSSSMANHRRLCSAAACRTRSSLLAA